MTEFSDNGALVSWYCLKMENEIKHDLAEKCMNLKFFRCLIQIPVQAFTHTNILANSSNFYIPVVPRTTSADFFPNSRIL